jgi:hypothetical protein
LGEDIIMADERLIPESMVKLLFDQVKESADNNTQAVREFSALIRDLSLVINNQLTRKEMCDMLKEHDQGCDKRWEETYGIIEKDDKEIGTKINGASDKVVDASKNIDDAAKSITEIKTSLVNINTTLGDLKTNVKTMITVVLVASALLITAFYFVKSASDTSINTTVKAAVQEAVKEIITSRPGNVWPLPEDKK